MNLLTTHQFLDQMGHTGSFPNKFWNTISNNKQLQKEYYYLY